MGHDKLLFWVALIPLLGGVVGARAGEFEDLGVPVTKAGIMGVLVGPDRTDTRDLVYFNFMQAGEPVFVLSVDPDTGETHQYGAPLDHCAWAFILGPDRKVYVGTTGHGSILCLDPAKPEEGLKLIGRPSETETYIWQFCVGRKDGKIYGCTYGNAKLVSYDPKTGELEDLGRMDETQDYARTIAAGPNGKIYTGIGMAVPDLVVYDPETREHRSVLLPDGRKVQGYVSVWNGADGHAYASIGGEGGGTFRLDDEALVPVDPGEAAQAPLKLRDGRLIQDLQYTNDGGSFVVHDPATGENRTVEYRYRGAGSVLFMCAPGPDGCIYGSTAMPMELFRYDPRQNRTEHLGQLGGGEVYSMLAYGGRLYCCCYSPGDIMVYDPTKPWNFGTGPENNPRDLGALGDGHCRPRQTILGPDDRLYVVSYAPYGQLGGAMAVFDPRQDKVVENYRHLIRDQSLCALAYEPQSGLIFGGSSIIGGGGSRPSQKEAKFFAFDPQAKELVMERTLEPGCTTIPAMLAVDGKVFVTSNASSNFFVYDPAEGKMVHTGTLPGSQVEIAMGQHTDGLIYGLTTQHIYTIDPQTYEVRTVAEVPGGVGAGFALTDTGIYFVRGVRLYRYVW